MYKKAELAPSPPSEFELPFGGRLSADNRWLRMAQIIPWSEFESEYAANFPERKAGLFHSDTKSANEKAIAFK